MDTAAALAPFAPVDRGIDEPDPVRAALRAAGPVVRVDAPAGGSAWIVTDEAVARAALVDPRITRTRPGRRPRGTRRWPGSNHRRPCSRP